MPLTVSERKYQSTGAHMNRTMEAWWRMTVHQKPKSHGLSSRMDSMVYARSALGLRRLVVSANTHVVNDVKRYRGAAANMSTSMSIVCSVSVAFMRYAV